MPERLLGRRLGADMRPAVATLTAMSVGSTSERETPVRETTPRPLLLAAAIVGVEGLIGIGYGLYLLAETVFGTPREIGQAIAVGVTLTLFAAPIPLVARALAQARMWARTPAVMIQLFALWMAYFMLEAGAYFGAVPTTAAAVAGLVCIFLPASTSALTRHWREDRQQ